MCAGGTGHAAQPQPLVFAEMRDSEAAATFLWEAGETPAVEMMADDKKIKDGTTVQITSDQAFTYSTKTKDNVPSAALYPLPKGARDTVVGSRITYKKQDKVYYYYQLKSGLRVSADDVKAVSSSAPSRNSINDLTVKTGSRHTSIVLDMDQRVTYKVKYSSASISFTFQNTSQTPSSRKLTGTNGRMFSKAVWDNKTLTLHFTEPGTFMGYTAYYDKEGNLVLQFRDMPGDITRARIAVDAGHGGKDNGALGSNPDYHEKDINKILADCLVRELESRGASVLLIDGAGHSGEKRREMAEKWDADVLISIHCNSASNKKATGTEVYYYQSFNSKLATLMSREVSGSLDTDNRGAKKGIFHVTLSSRMQSVLVETGFISNSGEYQKLLNSSFQKEIADGMADALEKLFDR